MLTIFTINFAHKNSEQRELMHKDNLIDVATMFFCKKKVLVLQHILKEGVSKTKIRGEEYLHLTETLNTCKIMSIPVNFVRRTLHKVVQECMIICCH
jgi:hypothetical protein